MDICKKGKSPKYIAIAEDLKQRISAGEFAQGGYIPTIRVLAEHYSCALFTVQKAQKLLLKEGIITGRQGQGIKVLSYHSNPRRNTIMLVFPEWDTLQEESFAAQVVLGATMKASELGLSLETYPYSPEVQSDYLCLKKDIDFFEYAGVLWANPSVPQILAELRAEGVNVISTHRHFRLMNVPYTFDDFAGIVQEFTRRVKALGIKSMAVLKYIPDDFTYDPVMGFLIDECRAAGICIEENHICHCHGVHTKEFSWLMDYFLHTISGVDALFSVCPNFIHKIRDDYPALLSGKKTVALSIQTESVDDIDIVLQSDVKKHAEYAMELLNLWHRTEKIPDSQPVSLSVI